MAVPPGQRQRSLLETSAEKRVLRGWQLRKAGAVRSFSNASVCLETEGTQRQQSPPGVGEVQRSIQERLIYFNQAEPRSSRHRVVAKSNNKAGERSGETSSWI